MLGSRGHNQRDTDTANQMIDAPETEEADIAKGLPCPILPSKAEREEHNRTHMPYRDWCDACVKGRGLEDPHHAASDAGDRYRVPQLSGDY